MDLLCWHRPPGSSISKKVGLTPSGLVMDMFAIIFQFK